MTVITSSHFFPVHVSNCSLFISDDAHKKPFIVAIFPNVPPGTGSISGKQSCFWSRAMHHQNPAIASRRCDAEYGSGKSPFEEGAKFRAAEIPVDVGMGFQPSTFLPTPVTPANNPTNPLIDLSNNTVALREKTPWAFGCCQFSSCGTRIFGEDWIFFFRFARKFLSQLNSWKN